MPPEEINSSSSKPSINIKTLPFTPEEAIKYAEEYQTPFHIYDEATIRSTCWSFNSVFNWAQQGPNNNVEAEGAIGVGFKNYFAIKATPNPTILQILKQEGLGVDCCSMTELTLAEIVGFKGAEIYFTSNNATIQEFTKAKELGAIINIDDFNHLEYIQRTIGLPNYLSFRLNPGTIIFNSELNTDPLNSKFGMTKSQVLSGIKLASSYGVTRFGLHSMNIFNNCLLVDDHVQNAKMLFGLLVEIKEKTGIDIESVNLGGGIGLAYRPSEIPFNISLLGEQIRLEYQKVLLKSQPGLIIKPFKLFYECGRYITGPSGFIISRIIHMKTTYKFYLGLDASMVNLMRPALYNSYHHMTWIPDRKNSELNHNVLENFQNGNGIKNGSDDKVYDVVGSLMENIDKLAIDRSFESSDIKIGDLIIIHDTGAHGHSKGFNYNGKCRSAEYLRRPDGTLVEIRRAETIDDLFSTLHWNVI